MKEIFVPLALVVVVLGGGWLVFGGNDGIFGNTTDTTTITNPHVFEQDVELENDLTLTKSTFCINFYATSTNTLVKMTASSTATIEGTDGVMVMQYGACS